MGSPAREGASQEFAATPPELQRKAVSPGDKTRPYGSADLTRACRTDPTAAVSIKLCDDLNQMLDRSWTGLLENDAALRCVFDYSAVYGTLGSTPRSMDAAVFALFSKLFAGYQAKDGFAHAQAYKLYTKFPILSVTTRVSAAIYQHIGDISRVDPHFVRIPKTALQKSLCGKHWVIKNGNIKKSMRENVMMIAGGGLKKSFILKTLMKVAFRNRETDPDLAGNLDLLVQSGLTRRKVPPPKTDGEEVAPQECFKAEPEVFWALFNPRNTFEGLIDLANEVYGGPCAVIVYDELSLCVDGCGLKIPGVISIDEYIMFQDEGSELSKGAAAKRRLLKDAFIVGINGLQSECLPDVLGRGSMRNVEARYTFVSTDERRGTEGVDPANVNADMEATYVTLKAAFAAAVTEPRRQGTPMSVSTGLHGSSLLTAAWNAILRAARLHGVEGDPMVRVWRKGDELLLTAVASVYTEVMCDLSAHNPSMSWPATTPSIFEFCAISSVCRCALDMRMAILEAQFRISQRLAFEKVPSTSAPGLPSVEATMLDMAKSVVIHHAEALTPKLLYKKFRDTSRLRVAGWATYAGVRKTWRELEEDGIARVAVTAPGGGEDDLDHGYDLIADGELGGEAGGRKRRLEQIWTADGQVGYGGRVKFTKVAPPRAAAVQE